jgi:H+/Cl- antiporter ClcA
VGALAGVYLAAVHGLEELLWDDGRPRLPLARVPATVVTCVVGGLLVGLLRRRHDRDTPHDLNDSLAGLGDLGGADDAQPPPSAIWLVRATVLGIVSLGFGASLGPEAPLVAIAVGFGARIAPILRVSRAEAAYISASGALSGLFGGPLGSVVLPVEGRDRAQPERLVGYGLVASVAGLVTMLLVLPDSSGMRIVLPSDPVSEPSEVLGRVAWATVAALPATFIGLAVLAATQPAREAAHRWVRSPVLRGAAGGLALGACGAIAPLSLFSGQHETEELLAEIGERGAWSLLGLALVKLVATLACLSTGWFGGQIFPSVFLGLTVALVLTAVFASAPIGAVPAAGAGAATTAVLRKPLASVLILLFFFPPDHLLAMVTGAAVATCLVALLGDRAPAPHGLRAGGH